MSGLDIDHCAGAKANPGILVVVLVLLAAALTLHGLYIRLSPELWLSAIAGADGYDASIWVVHYSYLPRLAVSILSGAMLSLAATIFQQILRNPLAEPTTLGVSSGASFAVTATSIWAPGLIGVGREGAAIAGASAATFQVFGLSWKKGLSPISLILAGLIVGLYLGAATAVLNLFNNEVLQSIFLWSSGTLRQNSWNAVFYLLPRFIAGLFFALLLARPLTILSLDEESGRNLGLSLRNMRFVALGLAVSLSAFVVSAVGMIGFVGLAAPAIARLSGARTVRQQLVWAPLIGGSLLWLTDQFVQLLPFSQELPTGVGTAVLGTPILMWMLPRLKEAVVPPQSTTTDPVKRINRPWLLIGVGLLFLVAVILPALWFGQGPSGWTWLSSGEFHRLMHWRWPRSLAALSAGAMLAVAGTILQRMTANPMASPEVLGISSGAACGVILLAFFAEGAEKFAQIGAAAIGAFISLLAMLMIGRKGSYSPDRLLLAGIAIGTAFGALVALLMASGDPRMAMLLSWMAGSTYQVTERDAVAAMIMAAVVFPILPLFSRWLEILPLGDPASRALGVTLVRSRFRLLLVSAALTGAATLIVGPLSFAGLMAPHMARMMGLQRPTQQIYGSALIGAIIMLVADWLGRNLLFPYQVPAGLLATFVGGPYFMYIFRRRGA